MHLVIPDTHGEKKTFDLLYKENLNSYIKIVFIGDYWDSFHISFEEQVECFLEIIALKKKYPEKIVLLLGNHDIHYLTNKIEYSGYQHDKWREIQKLVQENFDLFQSAYQYKDVLFTHAGLSQTFFEYLLKPLEFKTFKELKEQCLYNSIAEFLNDCSLEKLHVLSHMQGNSPYNNISFIRPTSLRGDLVSEISLQIVGHTHSHKMRMYKDLIIVDSNHPLQIEL